MAFNISDMTAGLEFGGARPSLFQVQITNPINPVADIKIPIMCRSTQIPDWIVGVIPVPYMGRRIKQPGTRDIGDWNVTVINDEDWIIRNAMEQWNNSMNSLQGNLNTTGSSSPLNFKSQAIVTHYSKGGEVLRVYQMQGLWPSRVAGVSMDWDQGDRIMEFDVTFQMDDFQVIGGTTGNAGGN